MADPNTVGGAPPALRTFMQTLLGVSAPITEREFSREEAVLLGQAISRAERDGRDYIKYDDYFAAPGANRPQDGNDAVLKGLTDSSASLALTLGRAKFRRNADGGVVIEDRYDFPKQGSAAPNWYDMLHVLGQSVAPEGQGRPVRITLPRSFAPSGSSPMGGKQRGGVATPLPTNNTRTAMADPWLDYYSGAMAPPTRTPDGRLVPTPTAPQMTVEQMYEGIYPPASSGLTTRQVQTVAVDPFTGNPINATPQGNMPATRNALSQQQQQIMRDPMRAAPNEVMTPGGVSPQFGYQAGKEFGPQYRLLPNEGLPSAARDAVAAIDGAVPRYEAWNRQPSGQSWFDPRGGMFPTPQKGLGGPVQLHFDPSDVGAQNMANSTGAPVRTASGKTFMPMAGLGPPGSALGPNPKTAAAMAMRPVPTPVAAPVISQNPELQAVHDRVMGYDRQSGNWLSLSSTN